MRLIQLTTLAATAVSTVHAVALPSDASTPLYKQASAPVESRVADLLSRMTLADKTAQLIQGDIENWLNVTSGAFNASGLADSMSLKASQFYVGKAVPQSWIAENVQRAQEYLVHNTTLGIPAYVQSEAIHGFLVVNATIFNSPIAYACAWNPALVEKMAGIIAREARALGVNQLFAPLADLARELRYGRVEETYGEDPHLTGEIAYSYVVGLQAGNVSAMVKHFAGFSAPEQGLNTGPVHGGERELRTTWLPPFKRAIIDAGAYSVMSAYHSYDGIPAIADYHTLTEILRNEWGYKYFVVSDAGATDRLCAAFHMCRAKPIDSAAVTMYALPAGNDVEMGGGSFNFKTIPDLVGNGTLDLSIVDEAVRRVLRAKFAQGLFEEPYTGVSAKEAEKLINADDAVQLARQLDAESIVLLENRNNTLPLRRDANIALIGPMASGPMNYGDYVVSGSMLRGVTPLAGITAASKGHVTYTQGCDRWSTSTASIPAAVAAAKAADVAVVIVGTWSRDQNELWSGLNATSGEHVDVQSLKLFGAMGPLVRAVLDVGKPTVVVFSSGKPVAEPEIAARASALVQQFYPGEQGGHALADVLFGDVNPSGRLSVSVPQDIGAGPVFYDYLNSGRAAGGTVPDVGVVGNDSEVVFGHSYVLGTPEAMYEFGFGRSYTTFNYSGVRLDRTTAGAGDTVSVSVDVRNTGDRDGMEVVQVYVKDVIASVAVPNIALRGFKKVAIGKGESVRVEIPIKVADLGVWNVRMKYVVEPGEFVVFVGASSRDLRGNATLVVR
ncbi:glycoside hydrolase [Trichodelitschia bisporula]|uniref:beta-glucosidase n=1 Tax=Trichodelitschia bisporula TaxID=703511 RepID=A0A6G1I582_9PEZI|nr:glycoside hydrolase [Trichodelitschia bisporula]